MEKLKREFTKGGSDKVNHSYERVYQHFLDVSDEPDALLEIGLANYAPPASNSLFIWPRLFPNCLVYGADLQDDRLFNSQRADHPGPPVPNDIDKNKLKAFQVDQASVESLANFDKALEDAKFDIIIDDASHSFADSKRTFEVLLPRLTGFYFIEDIARVVRPPQQNIGDWHDYLKMFSLTLGYQIVDARPEDPTDQDSVIVVIWKLNK
jgi:hypothetical protein